MTEPEKERLYEKAPKEVLEFLDEPYELRPEKIDFFQENGYVKLEQVLTGPALVYYKEILKLAVKDYFKKDSRSMEEKSTYEQSFLQAHSMGLRYPAIKTFVHSKRFAMLGRDLMKVDGVRFYFDQSLFKEPGGRVTDYHQDTGYWPISPEILTCTIWIALSEVPREMGCMAFARASHKLADHAQFTNIFGAKKEMEFRGAVKDSTWDWVPLAMGDCTFHTGLTFHRADPNTSNTTREGTTIAYMKHDSVYDWPEINTLKSQMGNWAIKDLKRGDPYHMDTTPRLV